MPCDAGGVHSLDDTAPATGVSGGAVGSEPLRKPLISRWKFLAADFDTLRSTLTARRWKSPPLPAETALSSGREHIAKRPDRSGALPLRGHNSHTEKKSLASSNRHLSDATAYRRGLVTNVSSSTAIETGRPVKDVSQRLTSDIKSGRLTGS